MLQGERATRSRVIALAATFAAITVVLDSIPIIPGFYSGIWDSWIFLITPLVGVFLGPFIGAASILMGSIVGHMVYFRDVFELVFMVGAALGGGVAGLIYRQEWRLVLGIYTMALMVYFVHPVSWILPILGIWDVIVGYALLVAFALAVEKERLPRNETQKTTVLLLFCGIIGLELDILFRVVLFVPGQMYWLFYGLDVSQLQLLWLAAGIVTPIKVAFATAVIVMLGLTLLRGLDSSGLELPS